MTTDPEETTAADVAPTYVEAYQAVQELCAAVDAFLSGN